MSKIFLHIFGNLVLSILAIPFGIILSPFLFEKYYCFIFYIIISFLFIFLIEKKKYIILIYLFIFLIITYVFSYGTYKAFFDTTMSKKEKIRTVKQLEEKCNNEPKDIINLNCSRYFNLIKLCEEKIGKTSALDCADFIINGSIVEINKNK